MTWNNRSLWARSRGKKKKKGLKHEGRLRLLVSREQASHTQHDSPIMTSREQASVRRRSSILMSFSIFTQAAGWAARRSEQSALLPLSMKDPAPGERRPWRSGTSTGPITAPYKKTKKKTKLKISRTAASRVSGLQEHWRSADVNPDVQSEDGPAVPNLMCHPQAVCVCVFVSERVRAQRPSPCPLSPPRSGIGLVGSASTQTSRAHNLPDAVVPGLSVMEGLWWV